MHEIVLDDRDCMVFIYVAVEITYNEGFLEILLFTPDDLSGVNGMLIWRKLQYLLQEQQASHCTTDISPNIV